MAPLSNDLVIDLFSELFGVCRNGAVPAKKLDKTLMSMQREKAITASDDFDKWMCEIGDAF